MTQPRFPVGFLLCCLFCCSDASAQYNHQSSNPSRKKSAMEKLSEVNQRLKANLKQSLFGAGATKDSQQNYQGQHGGYRQLPQYSSARNERQSQPDDYRRGEDDTRIQHRDVQQRASLAQYHQEIQYDRPSRQSAGPGTRAPHSGEVNPGPYRRSMNESSQPSLVQGRGQRFDAHDSYAAAVDTHQQNDNANVLRSPEGQQYGARSESAFPAPLQQPVGVLPLPHQIPPSAPLPAHPNQANQNREYRSGHYQNGSMTQQHLDQQETATQRVLRLYSEKQSLIEAQRSTAAENSRLRSQLREKTALLMEIEAAINAARTELQKANQNNRMLNDQISKLESEKSQQLRASTRQLNAIRKNLDDVLMLEMTSK